MPGKSPALIDVNLDLGTGNDNFQLLIPGSWTELTFTGNTFDGGTGVDRIAFDGIDDGSEEIAAFQVDLSLGTLIFASSPVNIVQSFENVVGSGGGDTIIGSALANVLDGAEGDDSIIGGEGDDTLGGGSGDDTVTGENGNNSLAGGPGDDTLNGGQGMDTLWGEGGINVFTGGADADNFGLGDGSGPGPLLDQVTDFAHAEGDKLVLSGIDAIEGGFDNAFTLIGANGFSGTAGELHYVVGVGRVTVEGDTNGDSAADFSIIVLGVATLAAEDFVDA